MEKQQLKKFKLLFTSVITITIWSMLIWQFTHDGVPSHYLFQNPELPELSNWWGGIILPALSWLALSRVEKTLLNLPSEQVVLHVRKVTVHFIVSLAYGAMLSFAFLYGYSSIASVMFPGILFFAIFFQVFRAEFVLGFILSMSITFGAVLSLMFGAIIAIAAFIVYSIVHFACRQFKKITAKKQLSE